MSRTALLLAAAALPSRTALGPLLDGDPFQVGLYCAVENGAPDYECAKVIARTPRDEFASVYRRNLRFAAKQYLRQLPNLAAAHVAIFLKIMGPLTVFTHSEHGSLHALQQAEHDLETGSVRAALVCSAFSLEDPLSSARTRRRLPAEVTLSEAAAALVLVPGGGARHWRSEPGDGQRSYGIAHPLVALARPGGAIAAAGVEGAPR